MISLYRQRGDHLLSNSCSERDKVPIAIDALSDFIFLGNLQKAAVVFSAFKEAVLAKLEGEAYGLNFLYGV